MRAVQAPRAEREGGDRPARHEGLPAVGDRAGLDQRQDAVAQHLGVDAEVALVLQLHHHRVGNAAIADLQGGAVVDQLGHVLADRLLHRADLGQADLEQRLVALHQAGDLGDVHQAVAVGEGHVRVHLEQHHARAPDRRHGVVGREREAEVAVLVHRRGQRHHHVGRLTGRARSACGSSEK
jgi:hypothetical protein